MGRDAHHSELVKRANRARYKALKLLISAHQNEFDRIYGEQAALEGVTSKPKAHLDAEQIEAKIVELRQQLDQVKAGSNGHG